MSQDKCHIRYRDLRIPGHTAPPSSLHIDGDTSSVPCNFRLSHQLSGFGHSESFSNLENIPSPQLRGSSLELNLIALYAIAFGRPCSMKSNFLSIFAFSLRLIHRTVIRSTPH